MDIMDAKCASCDYTIATEICDECGAALHDSSSCCIECPNCSGYFCAEHEDATKHSGCSAWDDEE